MATEVNALEQASRALAPAESLVARARRRLSAELATLPADTSPAWRVAVASGSFGALVHGIRVAARNERSHDARDLFVLLLQRTDGLNRRWVSGALWPLRLPEVERHARAEDLAQELTLLLWERIGLGTDEAWELFFQRALAFAQSHVSVAYLRRQGLRADPRALHPERAHAQLLVSLTDDTLMERVALDIDSPGATALSQAELADLRALIGRLPDRERIAVVLRFWQQASDAEIALALGGVTTRAVRYTVRRALTRLRAWYAGEDGDARDPEGERA